MTQLALDSVKLAKNYGNIQALKEVTFSIKKGEIFSLLGRNGAGKTTFARIATGQLMPTSGRLTVNGYDIVNEVEKVRENIAIVPQEARVIRSSSAREFIQLYLLMRGVKGLENTKQIALDALKKIGLENKANISARQLSGGERHKMLLACAIASDASILFLDEPSIGLDVHSRRQLWNILLNIKSEGKTIVLTTHYLDEAEFLSDRIAIINKGVVCKIGSPASIIKDSGFELKLDIDDSDVSKLTLPKNIMINKLAGKSRILGNEKTIKKLVSQALSKKLKVSVAGPNLEDAFLNLVGAENEQQN